MTSLPLPTPYCADGLMPSWPGAGPMVSPTLARSLLLAVLLHVWLVLLLGNAPGGTAQRGQGVWGAINVTLRGPETRGVVDRAPPAESLALDDRIQRVEPVAPIERTAPALMPPLTVPTLRAPAELPTPAIAPPALAEMPAAERRLVSPLPAPSGAVPALAAPAPAAAVPVLATAPTLAPLPEALSRLSPAPTAPPAAVAPLPTPGAVPLAEAVALPAAAMPAWATAPPVPGGATGSGGAADAGSQVGRDVATPPSAAASVPPRLNLQLARPRRGELSRFSSPGVLQLLPRPPELPDKLATDIAKSAKEDCRSAHQGFGLLAVVPLAVEALKRDGGCKW